MLEFKEVTYLYRLAMYAGTEEIRTNEGYVCIDYNWGYYWNPLTVLLRGSTTPWHFFKRRFYFIHNERGAKLLCLNLKK